MRFRTRKLTKYEVYTRSPSTPLELTLFSRFLSSLMDLIPIRWRVTALLLGL